MKDEILREKLNNLSSQQLEWINEYCVNDMSKLKKISYNAFFRYGIPAHEHDELYDDAMNVLMESVINFDSSQGASFKTYLINNIKKSVIDWYRDNYQRCKRKNLLTDKNGKIVKVDKNGNVTDDDKGKPVIIPDTSFDAPTEEDNDLVEKIASDFNVEDKSEFDFSADEKVDNFIDSLPKIQKNILLMRMENVPADNIKQKLNISDREYSSAMKSIKINKGLSVFSKNKNDGNYDVEVNNMEDRIIEISESENYRTDKYSMYSLLQDKKNGDVNCNYILQREPFQWTTEEANRYFCRILSNLPIPEIILCEQKKKGLTISHLIDGLQRLSYAEAFKENRIKIGSAGAERHLIQYRDYVLDDNGNRVLDEDGLPEYEMKIFDVIGKYYKDLPDELKKRFNNFNINVTKFFDCTDEQIADHIRDYNNHASMNKEQGGFLNVSAQTAGYIKNISQKNTFFKNCGKFTDNNVIKGKLERVVAESIMLMFFRDSWKAKLDTIYKYVDENATEQQFLKLNSHFNRLELALGEDNKDLKLLLTPTTMPMWIAVFDKFTTYNMDDSNFVDFLNAYNTELKDKEIDGVSMADFKDQQTKKKATITGKIDLLVKLMNEFLHIDITETSSTEVENNNTEENEQDNPEETTLSFVQENVNPDATEEDIDEYTDLVDYCFNHNQIKIDIPLYQKCQMALIALMAYACKNNREDDFEKWIKTYQNQTNFSLSQKDNYTYMKESMNRLAVA
ncbi:sigma factor [Roseburia faecis]|uniref:sigma factor n=1 Tax=Roseburia faecis TaxID=301302 RepID=UPI0031B63048